MRLAVLIAVCLTAGCYSYLPLTAVDPEPGASLELTLTDAGAAELGRYLGPDVFAVRGRFVRTDEERVFLAVTATETRRGDWHPWAGEAVGIPTANVAATRVRQFARGRTLLLAGAGVVGVAATAAAFSLTGGGNVPSPVKPPPPK